MKRLYLVRHGTVHNPEGITYRRLPGFHLSAFGREQAAMAGDLLRREQLETIYHSPMERAEETARLLSERFAHPPILLADDRINEWDTEEVFTDVAERMLAFYRSWLDSPVGTAVAVSHRDPIRALLHALSGTEMGRVDDAGPPYPLAPCGIFRLDAVSGEPPVITNFCGVVTKTGESHG